MTLAVFLFSACSEAYYTDFNLPDSYVELEKMKGNEDFEEPENLYVFEDSERVFLFQINPTQTIDNVQIQRIYGMVFESLTGMEGVEGVFDIQVVAERLEREEVRKFERFRGFLYDVSAMDRFLAQTIRRIQPTDYAVSLTIDEALASVDQFGVKIDVFYLPSASKIWTSTILKTIEKPEQLEQTVLELTSDLNRRFSKSLYQKRFENLSEIL